MILKEDDFTEISGIGKKTEEKLKNAGFKTYKDLENASIEQLTSIKGIFTTTAEKIKNYFKEQSLNIKAEDNIEEKVVETITNPLKKISPNKTITSSNLDRYINETGNKSNDNNNQELLEARELKEESEQKEYNESDEILDGKDEESINEENAVENNYSVKQKIKKKKESNSEDNLVKVNEYDKKFEEIELEGESFSDTPEKSENNDGDLENKGYEEEPLNEEVSKLPFYNQLASILDNNEIELNVEEEVYEEAGEKIYDEDASKIPSIDQLSDILNDNEREAIKIKTNKNNVKKMKKSKSSGKIVLNNSLLKSSSLTQVAEISENNDNDIESKDYEGYILDEKDSKLDDSEVDNDQVKSLENNNREELGVEDFSKLPDVSRLLKKENKTVSNVIDEFISDDINEPDIIEKEEVRDGKKLSLPQEEKKKSQIELLSNVIVQKLINSSKEMLKSKGFYVLSKNIKGADLLAIKTVKAKNLVDHIIIIPLKVSNLKGSIIVSNEALKYVSADHLPKQVLILIQRKYLDVLVKDVVKVPKIIYSNLCKEGSIFRFLKSYLKLKIKVEKSRSGTVLFFRDGSLQFKIFVEPVLICQDETHSSENSIAFPYFPERNLHIINCNKLQNLVDYLEVKYMTIEKYDKKKDNDIVQYFRVKNKTIDRLRLLSIPFAFYGGIFLLLVVFQLFEAIRVFTLLSYGVLSIYFLIIIYLYYNFYSEKKRIIKKSKEPYYKNKLELDDYDLNFIKEELDYDFLNQFFFECIDSESKTKSSFSLNKSVKNNKTEKKSQYGTFLED